MPKDGTVHELTNHVSLVNNTILKHVHNVCLYLHLLDAFQWFIEL